MLQSSAKNTARLALIMSAACFTMPALAHNDTGHAVMSLATGFTHPFSGLDHLLAMLAVGLWAAQQNRSARWLWPLAFPLMMAAGALASLAGWHVPGVEAGIAGSVAVFGLLIAFAFRLPLWAGTVVVSLFAIVHGHAHGSELPGGAAAGSYVIGFIAATVLLHLNGVAVGLAAREKTAARAVRLAGAGIAAAGVYFLTVLG